MRIGVLALQGAFYEHIKMLEDIGVSAFEIRQRKDVEANFDGLIIPGGESTVMGKLLRELNMFATLQSKIQSGLPVFGTCAGLILLSKEIDDGKESHLATMNISAKRNAYGRQLGSFRVVADFKGIGQIPMTFIRAPYISKAENDVEILAVVDGRIVAARQNNQLAIAFHPELDNNPAVHQYFVNMVGESNFKR